MKRKILMLITVILIIALCTGCGKIVKNEEELLTDLIADSSFYMVEGSEVTELSIIKRLTDVENKTDKVYVSINIEHEAATATQAYIMYYTCYNEGWLLDDIEEYYGDEVEWTTVPKGAPTNEQIMEALINYSNSQIDASYADQFISEELTHTYFFEEGKYYTEIYSGDMVSESEYSCFVTTYRNFDYMEVREKQLLRFMFDYYSYEWYLYDDEIIWIHGDAYIDGTWRVPTNGATLQFEMSYGSYGPDAYAEYDAVCTIDGETLEYSFTLPFPSTRSIDASSSNIGDVIWDPVCLSIEIAPDMTWCYDWFYEYSFELEPIELDGAPSALESTGIVDMSTAEEAEPYREMARNVLSAIFVEPDVSYVKEMWHPTITGGLSLIEEIIFSGEYQATTMIHEITQIVSKDEQDKYNAQYYFEDLKEAGCNASELIFSTFYLELWDEGEVEYEEFGVLLAKESEQVYVILIQ